MLKTAFAISLMTLLACGSGDTNQGAAATPGELSPVAAAGSGIDSAPILEAALEDLDLEAALEDLEVGAFEIESCLDLVASGEFADAIPICLEAAAIAPGNTEVQAALGEAQAKSAAGELSEGALDESIGDAAQEAIPTQRAIPPRP